VSYLWQRQYLLVQPWKIKEELATGTSTTASSSVCTLSHKSLVILVFKILWILSYTHVMYIYIHFFSTRIFFFAGVQIYWTSQERNKVYTPGKNMITYIIHFRFPDSNFSAFAAVALFPYCISTSFLFSFCVWPFSLSFSFLPISADIEGKRDMDMMWMNMRLYI